ncbi:MAG: LLM class flavin-dependent oxidoreductase [Candidatus Bathyarchaeota archaeon]|nr:MAG: LLM class flavin-dependent oxidoreductase [Candidatus Bathyarchaeota archaeon]
MNKICISLSSTSDWETIKRLSSKAEKLDYHSVWFGDHLTGGGGLPAHSHNSRFECWTLMSALAPQLTTLRVGPLVLSNSFRNPALLAKMAATLDSITNGRLEIGIGAGWMQREYEAYGYEYPPPAVRIGQMEEGIKIMKLLWTEKNPNFKGKYYSIKDSVCEPKPVQKPYPPLMIGGSGEKLTLRIVAKEADRCNFGLRGGLEQYKHLLNVLRSHCEKVGRSYDEIEKSLFTGVCLFRNEREMETGLKPIHKKQGSGKPFDDWLNTYKNRVIFGTVDDCVEKIKAYSLLGVTCYILRFEGGEHSIHHEEGFNLFNEHVLNEIR